MFIYERENDNDKNIEVLIPDEIKNNCRMDELVQALLSAKQGTEEELTTAKKNLTIASIKNSIADIIATEVKKLIATTATISSIVDFMVNECDVIPEIRMLGNDLNFLRNQDIKFVIREDVYADICLVNACVMLHEYDVKVSFFNKSGVSPYGGWLFDCNNKEATHVIDHICIPGVNEPDPETVEFINNFIKKLCDNIGFGITSTGIFEIPSNNNLDKYTNPKNTMYGVCDNESEDDDGSYDDDYDDDEYEYDDDYYEDEEE